MYSEKLSICPTWGKHTEKGFYVRTQGLSWIPSEKMKQFAFQDKDLNEAGLRQFFPSKAAYDLNYHCPECKIYIIDYGESISRDEANILAESV